MNVPSRRFAVAGGLLVSEPRAVPTGVFQGHVFKHPFGVYSLAGGEAWETEDWTGLGVIDGARRSTLVAQVLGLRHGRAECSVPELRGATGSNRNGDLACVTCPGPLATACAGVTSPSVGADYLAVLEEMLDAVCGPSAQAVPKAQVSMKLAMGLRNLVQLRDLVVGYVGLDERSRRRIILRLSRGDGVRAELFFEEPNALRWRTIYRDPGAVRTPAGWANFMGGAPPQASPEVPLSDLGLVSRLFWEKP